MHDPFLQKHGRFWIVRHDLIPGGTKQLALERVLESGWNMSSPIKKRFCFVYAGPAQGYAQIALAEACKRLGVRAVCFVAKRKELHERTQRAKDAGAEIMEVPVGRLNVVRARAREFCQRTGAELIPFGLDAPLYLDAIAWEARLLSIRPSQVWTVAGSGVLTRSLQLAWPEAEFIAVQVGKEPNIGKARLICAPERYEDAAEMPPPFPSCSNYDAKAWRFFEREAQGGALFWNVAR